MHSEKGFIAYYNIFLMMLIIASLTFVKFSDNVNQVVSASYFNKIGDYAIIENDLYVYLSFQFDNKIGLRYYSPDSYKRGISISKDTIDKDNNYYKCYSYTSKGYFDGLFFMNVNYYKIDGVITIDSWTTDFKIMSGYPKRSELE